MAKEFIEIRNPEIAGDKRVSFDLSCSKGVKKFLLLDRLYAEYDVPILEVEPSILLIPAVSGVITLAWAFGADVYVEELDKAYLEYLRRMESVLTHWFRVRNFSYAGRVSARKIVSNNSVNDGYGLLFTGGVDSLASYLKHKDEKPILIHVWGADIHPDDEVNGKRRVKRLAAFAYEEEVPLHIIRTNIPKALNDYLLYVRYGLIWWLQVSHSFVLTGVCAPLSAAANVGTLYVASAVTQEFRIVCGSTPLIATKLSWDDTDVVYDSYDLGRQLKIKRFIKDYIKQRGNIFLKVCNNTERPETNCGHCGKCLRTITELAIEGIDPNNCGFNNVNSQTFQHIREGFEKEKLFRKGWVVESEGDYTNRVGEVYYWKDMQKNISEKLEDSPARSEEFLSWFRDFDISEYLRRTENSIRIPLWNLPYVCLLNVCTLMPGNMQRSLKKLIDFVMSMYLRL
ncbi:MAG: hypothetical protein PVH12_01770 [Candidatus Bathyarchaeota archaeon]|jgi:hypothetical protein